MKRSKYSYPLSSTWWNKVPVPVPEGFLGMYSLLFLVISIDLTGAYFHVPVADTLQRFLWFAVGQQHLQFTFGLSKSPRVFYKILLALVALIRMRGIRLHHNLHILLLLSQDRRPLVEDRDQVLNVLQEFRWLVNQEKSPTQSLSLCL